MKKTPLKRSTPLKAKTQLKAKTALKAKSTFKKSSRLNQSAPLKPKSAPTIKVSLKGIASPAVKANSSSRRGLSGLGKTKAHEVFIQKVVSLGCMACNRLGLTPISRIVFHHPLGRNKGLKGDVSEAYGFGLCWNHHDPSTACGADNSAPSVHCNKKLFVKLIGTERWCVHETYRNVSECPPWLDSDTWKLYLDICEQEAQEFFLLELERSMNGYRQIESLE